MTDFAAIESRAFSGLNATINAAVAELIKDIQNELAAQGHNLSGRLSRSLTQKIYERGQEVINDVEMLKYGAYQNEGVKPSRIPFGRAKTGSPGGTSKFIQALQQWVRDRGIAQNDKTALRIAFAIAKKMKKEGMPNRGAKKYSSNGRRRGFINVPFARGRVRTEKRIAEGVQTSVGDMLEAVILDLDKEFENLIAA